MTIFDWLTKNIEWLFSGVAVAVVGALWRWIVNRKANNATASGMPENILSITSNNQSGGITAHTVNVHEIQRAFLRTDARATLLARFDGMSAYLHRYSESPEVNAFCKELVAALIESGWNARESMAHGGDSSIENVVIEINAMLKVGDHSRLAATCLKEVLTDQGFNVELFTLSQNPLPENSMYLRVGPAV